MVLLAHLLWGLLVMLCIGLRVWSLLWYYCVVFKLVALLISIGNRLCWCFCRLGVAWLCVWSLLWMLADGHAIGFGWVLMF